jgi:hypothetical protein
MYRLIGDKVRGLVASAMVDECRVHYRGEPNIVPTRYYPFDVTYVARRVRPEGREGYDLETGTEPFEYQGYVAVEVLMKDTTSLKPGAGNLADIPSYDEAVRLIELALEAVLVWGGVTGNMSDDPLVTDDQTERTDSMVVDDVGLGIGDRQGNYSNRASFDFRVYTNKLSTGTW